MKNPLIFLCMLFTLQGYSQAITDSSNLKNSALNVFLDCTYCDMDYLKTEISIINYVRDRKEADVDIVASSIQTGGGGQKLTFVFIGQNKFGGQRDTLKTNISSFVSSDGQRKAVIQILKAGLASYIAKTSLADKLNITFIKDTAKTALDVNVSPAIDKWKSWVFTTTIGGNMNNQQLTQQVVINPGLTISKITPDWKVNLNYQLAYLNFSFDVGDSVIKANLFAQAFSGSYVKSLGEHFSAGMATSINQSTQNNYQFQTKLGPEFEYSVFPYAESTHRQLRFIYAVYGVDNHYMETTIYGKMDQQLAAEALTAYSQYKEKWGSLTAQVTGAHYLYDPSKYEVNLSLSLSLNLFEGFSINLNTSANLIHDQIFLPAAGPTETDILFGLQTLATTYQFQTGIQLTYTFGSIYNNIVNPRCGLLFPYN